MSFSDLRKSRYERQKGSASFANVQELGSSDTPTTIDSTILVSEEPLFPISTKPFPIESGLYKDLTSFLQIRHTSDYGRGVFTSRPVAKSSVLFSTKPHVAVLSTGFLESYCSNCFSPSSPTVPLKRCTKCHTLRYCRTECQTADWKVHKQECLAINRWKRSAPAEASIPNEPVRCLGRLLYQFQKQGPDSLMWKELLAMASHRMDLPATSFESHTHLAHSLVRYIGASSPADLEAFGLSSASNIVDLTSRFATNAFALTAPSLAPIGVVLSPLTALVNHSCDPNIAIVFPRSGPRSDEPVMTAVALKDIRAGEEILVSYIDTTLPFALRQKMLEETYNFKCQCSLCLKQFTDQSDLRESVWCPNRCGGVCPLPDEDQDTTRCSKCKALVRTKTLDSIRDLVRVGQEALEKATALELGDPQQALKLTTNIINLMTAHSLTPTSHPFLALNRLHCSLLISMLGHSPNRIDETIRCSASCVSALRELLPEGHPARGIALAELGKLLAVDEPEPPPHASEEPELTPTGFPPKGVERLRLARETLIRALQELEIGFGSGAGGGEVGESVRKLARGVDEELEIWQRGLRNASRSRIK